MCREIKFKVYDPIAKYMSKPFTLEDIWVDKIQFTSECKVLQFTGLKDKNGVDIYEGDIVVDLRYPIQSLRVAMDWYWTDNDGAHEEYIYGWQTIELHATHLIYPLDTKENKYEVIGNIYEKEVQDD